MADGRKEGYRAFIPSCEDLHIRTHRTGVFFFLVHLGTGNQATSLACCIELYINTHVYMNISPGVYVPQKTVLNKFKYFCVKAATQ